MAIVVCCLLSVAVAVVENRSPRAAAADVRRLDHSLPVVGPWVDGQRLSFVRTELLGGRNERGHAQVRTPPTDIRTPNPHTHAPRRHAPRQHAPPVFLWYRRANVRTAGGVRGT